MEKCNCGKQFLTIKSLNSHARFCKEYEKKQKKEFTGECECGKVFTKPQSLNAHYSHCLIHRKGKIVIKRGGWNVSFESRKKAGKTYTERILSGEIVPSFKGKKHSQETRQKLSSKMDERNNGYVKTKFYEIFCESVQKNVKVQGTWELEFATRLNQLGILWEKGHILHYEYDGIKKRYFPDFYIIERDCYVEIKGFWFKSKDGRIDDKRKMKLVQDQNPKITILILDTLEKIREFS